MPGFAIAIISGVAVGTLSGLIGIGGGILLVPILLYIFKVDMHIAVGTSLMTIIPTTIMGSMIHFQKGNVDWRLGIVIAIGALAGAILGSTASTMIPAHTLKKIFAIVLLILSLKVAYDAYFSAPQDPQTASQSSPAHVSQVAQSLDD